MVLTGQLQLLLFAQNFSLLGLEGLDLVQLVLEELVRLLFELGMCVLGLHVFLLELLSLQFNFVDLLKEFGCLFLSLIEFSLKHLPHSILERDHQASALFVLFHRCLLLRLYLGYFLLQLLFSYLLVLDGLGLHALQCL